MKKELEGFWRTGMSNTSRPIIPTSTLLSRITHRTEADVEDGLLAAFKRVNFDPVGVIDGDTTRMGRLANVDAFESSAGLASNVKAQTIANDYGIPLAEQKKLGMLGKADLQRFFEENPREIFHLNRSGYDALGRPLISSPKLDEYLINTGNFTATNRYDTKLQSLYRAKQEKIHKLDPEKARLLDLQREYSLDATAPSFKSRVQNSVRALGSGTQQVVAGTIDFLADVVTPGDNLALNDIKSAKVADKLWGYDNRESNFQKAEALHNWNNDEYGKAVGGMATSPELWGESLPAMAEMMLGAGKFTKLGKALKIGTEGLTGAARISEAKLIRDGATALQKATLLGANNAGFLGVVGDQTNRHIEEFTANNNGVGPSYGQVAGMTAMNVLQLGLDKFAFGNLIGTKQGINTLRDTASSLLKVIPDNGLMPIAKKIATSGVAVTSAMGMEAGQEYLQTWAELLNTRAGTDKYGDWINVLNNPESQDEAIIGMLAGAGMGAQMRAIPEAYKVTNTILDASAEFGTGRTVDSITKDKAANEIIARELTKGINSRRIIPTEDMNEDTLNKVNIINSQLDILHTLSTDTQTDREALLVALDGVDSAISRIGLTPVTTSTTGEDIPAEPMTPTEDIDADNSINTSSNTGSVSQVNSDTTEYDVATKSRAEVAGLVNILTKADRESGLGLQLHDEGTRTTLTSKKKPITIDPIKVDTAFIANALKEGVTSEALTPITNMPTNAKNFVKRIAKKMGVGDNQHNTVKEVYSKIKESFGNETANALEDGIFLGANVTPETALKAVALGMNALKGAITSEYDIANKYNAKPINGARIPGLDVQIGKMYVNSFGLKIVGDNTKVADKHSEIGNTILQYMSDIGLVSLNKTGEEVPLHNMTSKEGVDIHKGNQSVFQFKGKGDTNMVYMPTVSLASDDTSRTNKVRRRVPKNPNIEALNTFSKLFTPSNYKLPESEASAKVVYDDNNPISKGHKDIIRKMQEMVFHIKPEMLKLLKELKAELGEDIEKELSNNKKFLKLLGLHHDNANIFNLNKEGRSINRKGTLINLIENIDIIERIDKDGIHFSYESAINNRIHVLETILEFQGDKYMSRQMLTEGEYSVDTNDEIGMQLLIDDIKDNLPKHLKSKEDIVTKEGVSRAIDEAVKAIADNNGKGLNLSQLLLLNKDLKFQSVFKMLSVIQAIYDVRNPKGNKVHTQYMTESDAVASGIMNTLLNLIGLPGVSEALNKLKGVNKDGELDPYELLMHSLREDLKSVFDDKIQPILDKLASAGISERDLSKSPAMTSAYGQHAENAKDEMASNTVELLITKALEEHNINALNYINSLLGLEGKYTMSKLDDDSAKIMGFIDTSVIDITDISKEHVEVLKDYFRDNLSDIIVDGIDKAYPGIKAYRDIMGKVYKALDKSGKWDGKIASAIETMLGHPEKNRMSVRKLKGRVIAKDNTVLMFNEMMNNSTSFNVNLQHSVDAALLLLTANDVIEENGYKGIMTVHDALYSNPHIAQKIMKKYNHYTIEVAKNYDFLSMAMMEVNRILEEAKNEGNEALVSQLNATVKAVNTSLKEITGRDDMTVDVLREIKIRKLGEITDLRVLGNQDIDLSSISLDTITESKDKKTEAKKEESTAKDNNIEEYNKLSALLKAITSLTFNKKQGAKVIPFANVLHGMRELLEYADEDHKKLFDKIANIKNLKVSSVKDMWGGRNNVVYIPKELSMTIVGDDASIDINSVNTLIEIFAHEVDHAVQYNYIEKNIDSSPELKYLSRIVNTLSERKNEFLTPRARARLEYILNPGLNASMARKVSELSSIISNELGIRDEILNLIGPKTTADKIKDIVARVVDAVVKFIKSMTDEEINNMPITIDNTLQALKELDANAKVISAYATAKNEKTDIPGMVAKEDMNKEAFINPYAFVNDVIANQNRFISDWMIIWGTSIDDFISPHIVKVHTKLKHISPLYKEAVALIRTGFYDSDFAQRMHYILGITKDTKDTIIKESLSLFTDYQRELNKEREAMAELDRQLSDRYTKEEMVTINNIFANTAIANLVMMRDIKDELINGTKSIKELLDEVKVTLTDDTIKNLDNVAKYFITGDTTTNSVNVLTSGDISDNAYVYTTLKALSLIPDGHKILKDMDENLRNWMLSIALLNKNLNSEINEKGVDYEGNKHILDVGYHGMYDGTYSMDVHDKVYEYKAVTMLELRKSSNSSENGWVVIKDPTESTLGFIARESYDVGSVAGVGLNINRYVNGIYISAEQSEDISKRLSGMTDRARDEWLNSNSMVQDGSRFRALISHKTKVDKLDLVENAAHTLYRTYIHNKELVQTESIRRIILENGTENITSAVGMRKLEAVLKENDRKGLRGKIGEREEVYPFLSIDYSSADLTHINSFEDLKSNYPMIAKYYKTPTGLTPFNDFNKKVSLVKRGVSDVLLGHKNSSIFGSTDNRALAKYELIFKKMVVLAKQKMVVANPAKLALDSVTNMGVLSMMDVGIAEILTGYRDGLKHYKEYARERTKLVNLTMEAKLTNAIYDLDPTEANRVSKVKALAAKDAQASKLSTLEFHDAYNYGFVQSYSTDLVIKEFDTITGIQQDIDKFIDKYTHNKKGDPNKLFNAIKWWQQFGIGVDDLLRKVGNISLAKGTDTGDELVELADRLQKKKANKESVARYLGDIIGSPSSEVVNYGSAYMVLSDALSKYILAKHLMTQVNPRKEGILTRKKYTKEEAYSLANETFIDYRTNMPREVKTLSDYGILMFPAFWMKIQKVIVGLVKYQPVTTAGALAISTAFSTGAGAITDQNIATKFSGNQDILNNPVDLIDTSSLVLLL